MLDLKNQTVGLNFGQKFHKDEHTRISSERTFERLWC